MEEKGREQELSVREISLIRELTQIRKEHKRELEYEKFDGYELPPRTQFSMLNAAAWEAPGRELHKTPVSLERQGLLRLLPEADEISCTQEAWPLV